MNVIIRKWRATPPAYEEVGGLHVGAFEGLSFRRMDETPAMSVNFRNLRVTEVFLHPTKKDTLVVYCQEETL